MTPSLSFSLYLCGEIHWQEVLRERQLQGNIPLKEQMRDLQNANGNRLEKLNDDCDLLIKPFLSQRKA